MCWDYDRLSSYVFSIQLNKESISLSIVLFLFIGLRFYLAISMDLQKWIAYSYEMAEANSKIQR